MTRNHTTAGRPRRSRPASKRGRARVPRTGKARPAAKPDERRCRVTVAAPDGILAVIPHLLGFHPADSVVVLGIGGDPATIRLGCRYDLPAAEPSTAGQIASHAAAALGGQPPESAADSAVLVGYGSADRAEPVLQALAGALTAARIEVKDVLRAHEGRFWSLRCDDPRCCPAGGTVFDPAGHPAAAALDAAGLTARADRDALARGLDPIPDAAMDQAWRRALQRARRLIESALASGEEPEDETTADPFRLVAASGRRAVRTAIGVYRGGGEITNAEQLAWLGLTLTDLRVRDDAWSRMDPQHRHDHQRLWAILVRRLPAAFAAAPAALLAFTAWQSGDGPLAAVAVDRALKADPEYSMAMLIREALQAAAPPSAAVPPLTPRQVAASYKDRRASSRGEG